MNKNYAKNGFVSLSISEQLVVDGGDWIGWLGAGMTTAGTAAVVGAGKATLKTGGLATPVTAAVAVTGVVVAGAGMLLMWACGRR